MFMRTSFYMVDMALMPVSGRARGLTPQFVDSGIDLADTSAVLDFIDES